MYDSPTPGTHSSRDVMDYLAAGFQNCAGKVKVIKQDTIPACYSISFYSQQNVDAFCSDGIDTSPSKKVITFLENAMKRMGLPTGQDAAHTGIKHVPIQVDPHARGMKQWYTLIVPETLVNRQHVNDFLARQVKAQANAHAEARDKDQCQKDYKQQKLADTIAAQIVRVADSEGLDMFGWRSFLENDHLCFEAPLVEWKHNSMESGRRIANEEEICHLLKNCGIPAVFESNAIKIQSDLQAIQKSKLIEKYRLAKIKGPERYYKNLNALHHITRSFGLKESQIALSSLGHFDIVFADPLKISGQQSWATRLIHGEPLTQLHLHDNETHDVMGKVEQLKALLEKQGFGKLFLRQMENGEIVLSYGNWTNDVDSGVSDPNKKVLFYVEPEFMTQELHQHFSNLAAQQKYLPPVLPFTLGVMLESAQKRAQALSNGQIISYGRF